MEIINQYIEKYLALKSVFEEKYPSIFLITFSSIRYCITIIICFAIIKLLYILSFSKKGVILEEYDPILQVLMILVYFILPPLTYILLFSREKISFHPFIVSFLYWYIQSLQYNDNNIIEIMATTIVIGSVLTVFHLIFLQWKEIKQFQINKNEQLALLAEKHRILKIGVFIFRTFLKYFLSIIITCLFVEIISNFFSIGFILNNQYFLLSTSLLIVLPSVIYIVLFTKQQVSFHIYPISYFFIAISLKNFLLPLNICLLIIICSTLVLGLHIICIKLLKPPSNNR